EVCAVGAGVEPADLPAGDVLPRVRVPDVLPVVDGQRVVRGVHADGPLVVVVGQGRVDAEGLLERLASAAAAGEQVDDDFAGTQARGLRRGEVETVRSIGHYAALRPSF